MTLEEKLQDAEQEYTTTRELHKRALAAADEAMAQLCRLEGRIAVLKELLATNPRSV